MTKNTVQPPNDRNKDGQGSYASVNGLAMYYEIHGTGNPLVLLGGGFMTVEAMGQVLSPLSSSRQVIAVELQGHGHTLVFLKILVGPSWLRPFHVSRTPKRTWRCCTLQSASKVFQR
jgi:pimeloyl-ACP methyl ester carboxylesterase